MVQFAHKKRRRVPLYIHPPALPPTTQHQENVQSTNYSLLPEWSPMRWEDQRNTRGHIPTCHRTPEKVYRLDHYVDQRGRLQYKPANPIRCKSEDWYITSTVSCSPDSPEAAELVAKHLWLPLNPPPAHPLPPIPPKTATDEDDIVPKSFRKFQQTKLYNVTPIYPIQSYHDATARMIEASGGKSVTQEDNSMVEENDWEVRTYGTFARYVDDEDEEEESKGNSLLGDLERAGVDFEGRDIEEDWEEWWRRRGRKIVFIGLFMGVTVLVSALMTYLTMRYGGWGNSLF